MSFTKPLFGILCLLKKIILLYISIIDPLMKNPEKFIPTIFFQIKEIPCYVFY